MPTISPLGQAWLKQVGRMMDEQFDDLLARWPLRTGSDEANHATIALAQDWISKLPVASMDLVLAALGRA